MKFRALLLTLLFASSIALAVDQPGITISPMVGSSLYDDEDLDDSAHYSIGVGYQFDNPWAIELVYADTETDNDALNIDVDYTRWHLDGLYHFERFGDIRPYISFGAGRADYDFSPGGDDDESIWNVGAGFKYSVAESTAVRGDLKSFKGSDEDELSLAISIGIFHNFGARAAAPVEMMPVDSDNDGVFDDDDRCPGTPSGATVNARGCPLDTDRDGIFDFEDKCPGTTNRRARIDASGCYEVLEEKVTVELNVEFDLNSAAARPDHRAEVKRVYDFMQEYPQTRVTIEGHTDSAGSNAYNQDLSQRRANTIAGILINDFGVDATRVSSVGYGEAKPIASNDTIEGRQKNRRVVGVVEAIVEKVIRKQ